MKRLPLALVAALAASCTTPGGSSAPTRSFTFDLPPGCSLEGAGSERECYFATADGRERKIKIHQMAAPFPMNFDQTDRAAMRQDPKGFWGRAVTAWEMSAVTSGFAAGPQVTGARARAFAPPPGAEACVWFIFDQASGGSARDIQGVRCALYDPATDVAEEFMLEYEENRPSGVPPDPGFAADAERVVRTLRFAPPGARL